MSNLCEAARKVIATLRTFARRGPGDIVTPTELLTLSDEFASAVEDEEARQRDPVDWTKLTERERGVILLRDMMAVFRDTAEDNDLVIVVMETDEGVKGFTTQGKEDAALDLLTKRAIEILGIAKESN